MKKYLSLILIFLIVLSFPVSVYAKPTGGTTVNSITFTPSSPSVTVGNSITITANWKSTFAVNRTQWTVDGSPQTVTNFKSTKLSGTSSYAYKGTTSGLMTLTFRFWNSTNSNSYENFVFITVNPSTADTTPPVSTLSIKNGTLGSSGWYTSDVGI